MDNTQSTIYQFLNQIQWPLAPGPFLLFSAPLHPYNFHLPPPINFCLVGGDITKSPHPSTYISIYHITPSPISTHFTYSISFPSKRFTNLHPHLNFSIFSSTPLHLLLSPHHFRYVSYPTYPSSTPINLPALPLPYFTLIICPNSHFTFHLHALLTLYHHQIPRPSPTYSHQPSFLPYLTHTTRQLHPYSHHTPPNTVLSTSLLYTPHLPPPILLPHTYPNATPPSIPSYHSLFYSPPLPINYYP